MASAGTKGIDYDREKYQTDSMYRAVINMIYVPVEIETPDNDNYTEFFESGHAPAHELEPAPAPAHELEPAPAPELEPAPAPASAPEPKPSKKTLTRKPTTTAEKELQKEVYEKTFETMNIGTKIMETFEVKDINPPTFSESPDFILPKNNAEMVKLTLTPTTSITLKQKLKKKVIILELAFSGAMKIFNKIHLSFWPRIELPNKDPSTFTKADFNLFEKGSIHIVLELVKGILDGKNKGPIYLKLRIDDSTKMFYMTDEDFDSIGKYENGPDIQRFLKLIVEILNAKKDNFFPTLGTKLFRKTKKKKKTKTKRKRKRKTKKKKKTKRTKTRKK